MLILDALVACLVGVLFARRDSRWSWLSVMSFAMVGMALPGAVLAWNYPEWHSSYLVSVDNGLGVALGGGASILIGAAFGHWIGGALPRVLPLIMLSVSAWMWFSVPRALSWGGTAAFLAGDAQDLPPLFLGIVVLMTSWTGLAFAAAMRFTKPADPQARDTETTTFCRICEAHCGLNVQVSEELRVGRIKPDRSHPATLGFGCIKGMGLGQIHHDAKRLNHPLKRVGEDFVRISWDQAIAEIGAKLAEIRSDHGSRAIGMYRGNPSFFSFAHVLFADSFMRALGSPNLFTSVSVDSNNKFFVASEMFGHPMVQPIPDVSRTSFLLCLGSNPAVSQMSIIQIAHPLRRLQQIVDRGGRVVVVDPRLTETARRVGEHAFIHPGTDAALLLAMIHEICDSPAQAAGSLPVDRLDEARAVAADWTPERAAEVTGIPANTIRDLAKGFRDADGASIYHSTGVNMSGFGSLCTWLIYVLLLVTDNLDRTGGQVLVRSPVDLIALAPGQSRGRDQARTLAHGWPRIAGAFPSGALADEIVVDNPDRIRALIVSAGNPAHSIPGDRFHSARSHLELLVSIDLYMGETAALADYVLPATDMLEHTDFPIGWLHLQETPYAQYTPAVVPPAAERREEWRIFTDLSMAAGISPFGTTVCNVFPWLNAGLARLPGSPQVTPDHILRALLWWGGQISLSTLQQNPAGVLLPPNDGGALVEQLGRLGERINAAPAGLLADVARFESHLETKQPPETLRLIGLRERRTHNSWMHNHPTIKRPRTNTLRMNPVDANTRGILEGGLVDVRGGGGPVRLPVTLTTELMPGVVAMPHGWGHRRSRVGRAQSLSGANVNRAIPGGAEHMEPLSGQARMTGHLVRVTRVAAKES